jgi:hypothetical protein
MSMSDLSMAQTGMQGSGMSMSYGMYGQEQHPYSAMMPGGYGGMGLYPNFGGGGIPNYGVGMGFGGGHPGVGRSYNDSRMEIFGSGWSQNQPGMNRDSGWGQQPRRKSDRDWSELEPLTEAQWLEEVKRHSVPDRVSNRPSVPSLWGAGMVKFYFSRGAKDIPEIAWDSETEHVELREAVTGYAIRDWVMMRKVGCVMLGDTDLSVEGYLKQKAEMVDVSKRPARLSELRAVKYHAYKTADRNVKFEDPVNLTYANLYSFDDKDVWSLAYAARTAQYYAKEIKRFKPKQWKDMCSPDRYQFALRYFRCADKRRGDESVVWRERIEMGRSRAKKILDSTFRFLVGELEARASEDLENAKSFSELMRQKLKLRQGDAAPWDRSDQDISSVGGQPKSKSRRGESSGSSRKRKK